MTQPERERIRPGQEADSEASTTIATDSILADLDEIAHHVDGTFVVVVKVTGGKYRRRCYLTAKSAERAVRRATYRGESVTVYLAELKALWKVNGMAAREWSV